MSLRQATGVPASPERSSCVAVSTMRPTERRRVQTRRPARCRDTSGLTCMLRHFTGGVRALAVERTTDARDREL